MKHPASAGSKGNASAGSKRNASSGPRVKPSAGPGNIVLIGFMGTGKSSIGRHVAKRLDFRFVDTDRLIVESAGKSIPDIFAEKGEAFFRDAETAALGSLKGASGHVIATGGGIIDRPGNIGLLRALGFVVWFTASEKVIFERVSRHDKRPLLKTENPRQTIRRLLERRAPLYGGTADLAIDTSHLSHGEIADAVVEAARLHWK